MMENTNPLLGPIALVAVSTNGVIGRDQQLPWKLRSDLQRFKSRTMGHCLIMGRKTYESIGRPLPGRCTIIVSRQGEKELRNRLGLPMKAEGKAELGQGTSVCIASSFEEALQKVPTERTAFVVGGAEIYRIALPLCQRIWLTRVDAVVEGDAFFEWDSESWQLESSEPIPAGEFDQYPSHFEEWIRREMSP